MQSLPVVALITTGRTGSDFLQSLLDSHPQVATFNGHFLPYTEFFPKAKTFAVDNARAADMVDEFIGCYLYKLVSRYDIQEAKDCLGPDSRQSFEIDTSEFKMHVIGLLDGFQLNTANFILAIYGAYNLCLGQKIDECLIFFHHPHLEYEFKLFVSDFPYARILFTSRDPRANFFSHVEHFRRYYETHDNQAHIYNCLKMALYDSMPADEYRLEYTATRLEDFPREDRVKQLASWLGIEYRESMLRSTWAGLDWHGDRVSEKKFPAAGWSEARTENGWRTGLGWSERRIFNYIMHDRLKWYGYQFEPINILDMLLIPVLILLPFRCERRLMAPYRMMKILLSGSQEMRLQLLLIPTYLLRRMALCYRFYWQTLNNVPFRRNWLGK